MFAKIDKNIKRIRYADTEFLNLLTYSHILKIDIILLRTKFKYLLPLIKNSAMDSVKY